MKNSMILKTSLVAGLSIASSVAFAAAPPSTETQSAGTEIHWSAKVPMEFHYEGVILTSANGEPLTEALKGGDIEFLKGADDIYDGTFASSQIFLELHYRNCVKGGEVIDANGTTDCITDGGSYVDGNGKEAIGDLIEGSTWQLSSANFNIGGRVNPELQASGKIQMNGADMIAGDTATKVKDGKPVFTTINETAPATAPSVGTRYTVNAAIIASNGI